MQPTDQIRTRIISQLITGVSRVPRKLLKYFNGRVISTSLVLPLTVVLPVIFVLNLKVSESVMLSSSG